MKKIVLLATASKKQKHPAKVIDFYRIPLFKSLSNMSGNIMMHVLLSYEDGLLLPDQVTYPFDVSDSYPIISPKIGDHPCHIRPFFHTV